MKFIIRLFPEITIKSQPVRKRMNRQLTENLRIIMRRFDSSAKVRSSWDKLEVELAGDDERVADAAAEKLQCVPGIATISRVRAMEFEDLHSIYERTLAAWAPALKGKTFCVRVKRSGQHSFTSTEVESYVGGGLNQNTEAKGVDLHNPDVTVKLEVRDDTLYLVDQVYQGLGGFPMGSQESLLSLVSGGFDSTVASYQSIRRGLRTHFVFFNLGGKDHELGVKEIAFYLWSKFGSSHRVKFITVPFEGVVSNILQHVDPSCMGVVLKREMFRAASVIAERGGWSALVTGEAVAQVSSQTLTNLSIIDGVTDKLVLRPLAMMDKGEIINICRQIGAEEFAANIPEYCGVISVRPSASLRLHKVEQEEAKMGAQALEAALANVRVQTIDQLANDLSHEPRKAAPVVATALDATVVDIRHPNEQALNPLTLENTDVLLIPFYSLNTAFASMDASKQYLLYCERGVMSQLHANHLLDNGHSNVGVYRPLK